MAGKVALVTGGGTNLGKTAATELARCGATVVIAGRRASVLAAASEEIGCEGSWIAGDIREPSEARQIVGTVLDRHGRLDFLLNNAGGQYFAAAETITSKGWRAVMRLNVEGTLNMAQAAHELAMAPARAGTIINVTVSPHQGMPAMAHTGAARAVVEELTRELAAAWAPESVCVSAIALGRFATESLQKYPRELWRQAAQSVPVQRLGLVEEYAWLVALLASPLSGALSGSVITLDGGLDNWFGPWPPADLAPGGQLPTEARQARPAS